MITKINNKNWARIMMAGVFSFLLSSCSDMLDTESTRQNIDPEIGDKTDSVFYSFGILQAMQELADQYVFQVLSTTVTTTLLIVILINITVLRMLLLISM